MVVSTTTAATFVGLWTYLLSSSMTVDPHTLNAAASLRLDSRGNCSLFAALRNCSGASDDEVDAQTAALIDALRTGVLIDDTLTDDMRVVEVFERLHGFFASHPRRLARCTMTPDVNDDQQSTSRSLVATFLDSGKLVSDLLADTRLSSRLLQYKQIRHLPKVIGGDSALLLELLDALQDVQTLDVVYRDQVYLLNENLKEYFGHETRIFKRLEYVATQTRELLNPLDSGVYVDVDLGSWGSFDSLLRCADFYKQHGWHWNAPRNMAPHCAISSALIRRQPDGSSILTRAVDASWREWRSLSARSIFKGYLTRIKALVRGGEPKDVGLTSAQKLVEIVQLLRHFSTAPSAMFNELLEVRLDRWGTLREFVACNTSDDGN